jgi:ssDNA-binding Zn-finger/Zn-ribbon topoisomerase 1
MAYSTLTKTNNFASVGAVNQKDGSKRIHICDRCHSEVVWVKSEKTGKSYLCLVSKGYHDQRFYVGRNFHNCDEIVARQEAETAFYGRAEKSAEFVTAIQKANAEGDTAEVERLMAEYDEWVESL